MKFNNMPRINLDAVADLTDAERALAQRIINPKTGALRASKPPVPRKTLTVPNDCTIFITRQDYATEEDRAAGQAAYLWRMVAFYVSPIGQHQCMPCTADWDLDGSHDDRRATSKRLDELCQRIVDTVKLKEQHGTMRWARALGYVAA